MALDQPDFKKNKILILEAKLEILKKLSRGESGASLAQQYGVSKSTVSEIKRKGDILLQYASTIKSEDGLKTRKTLRKASNIALEEAVYLWFTERRNAGDPVSGPLICEKALEINGTLGGASDFKASSGWLKNFKTRHNIKMQDLIIADVTARVANNSRIILQVKDEKKSQYIQDKRPFTVENSASEMESTEAAKGCSIFIKSERTSSNESKMDGEPVSTSTYSGNTPQSTASGNINYVDKGYTVSFPTVTTILQPDQGNSEDADASTHEKADEYGGARLIIKEEVLDVIDNESDTAEEDPTGPSDNDALIAMDTAIDWLERQPDRKPSHLATLRKIRNFAIYKERLRSLTRGPFGNP